LVAEDPDEKLDLKATYTNSQPRDARGRACRTGSLLEERGGHVDVRWMMSIARTLQGIDQAGMASSCAAALPKGKHEMPVFWWHASVPSRGCYTPLFVHGSGLP